MKKRMKKIIFSGSIKGLADGSVAVRLAVGDTPRREWFVGSNKEAREDVARILNRELRGRDTRGDTDPIDIGCTTETENVTADQIPTE